jgi:hypothetical protein
MPRSCSDPEASKGSDVETIASLCVIHKVPLFVLVAIVPLFLQTPADRRLSRFHAPTEEIGFYFKDRRVIRLGSVLAPFGTWMGRGGVSHARQLSSFGVSRVANFASVLFSLG